MDVLQHEYDRRVGGEPSQHLLEHASPGGGVSDRPPVRSTQAGQIHPEAAQRGADRGVGQFPLGQRDALADQDLRPARLGLPLELVQQPALAHTGLPGHEHGLEAAGHHAVERLQQRAHLGVATDELRTGDSQRHAPILSHRELPRRIPGHGAHRLGRCRGTAGCCR